MQSNDVIEVVAPLGGGIIFGMVGVTLFGLIFTPISYMVVCNLAEGKNEGKPIQTTAAAARASCGDGYA